MYGSCRNEVPYTFTIVFTVQMPSSKIIYSPILRLNGRAFWTIYLRNQVCVCGSVPMAPAGQSVIMYYKLMPSPSKNLLLRTYRATVEGLRTSTQTMQRIRTTRLAGGGLPEPQRIYSNP